LSSAHAAIFIGTGVVVAPVVAAPVIAAPIVVVPSCRFVSVPVMNAQLAQRLSKTPPCSRSNEIVRRRGHSITSK
jgi:hypothetical protein